MELDIGDVVAVSDNKWTSFLIKLGALLTGKPALTNHVVVVHHRDAAGTLWGVEGRPSGTGWVDMAQYLGRPFVKDNREQYKTAEQREFIAKAVEGMVGTSYDWSAIVTIGMVSIGADRLWHARDWGEDEVPTHVICSSLADWAYEQVQLPSPGGTFGTRFTTPADWYYFMEVRDWENPGRWGAL